MLNQSKAALIILAVTGFARVAIFAVPVIGVYFGVNSDKTEQVNEWADDERYSQLGKRVSYDEWSIV